MAILFIPRIGLIFVVTTYSNLRRVSRSILDDWKSTIILPAFQLTSKYKQIVVSSKNPIQA